VNIIPADRLERARAKKYGIPYDPEQTAWIKSYVKWKNSNHRAQIARERTRDKRAHRAASPGSATAARKKVTPPETPDVKKPIKLRIVGRDGYTVAGATLWRTRSRIAAGPLVCQALSVVALYAAHSADSASAC
jgi:hypothetical protein